MRYSELLENISGSGQPSWKLDVDNKVYVVYDENNNEVSRHTFQDIWNSSPAKRAAEADVKKMRGELYTKKVAADAAAAEAKPLSVIEQKYYDLSKSVKKYQRYIYPKNPEDDFLDDETRTIYLDTATKWLNDMNRLAAGGTVRRSLIDGTYKPPA